MKRALVVDDTKNIRLLLTTCLELMGYEVITASNGEEALEMFKNNTFDLVMLDIKMPEISGTEVLRRIRRMGIEIPVIIMTAFATVKNAVECTRLGAVAYLQKPFTAEKVKNTLHQFENHNECCSVLEACFNKSNELIENGNYDEALSILKKALAIEPNCAQCYNLIGKIHELKGNIKDAEKFYKASKIFD